MVNKTGEDSLASFKMAWKLSPSWLAAVKSQQGDFLLARIQLPAFAFQQMDLQDSDACS